MRYLDSDFQIMVQGDFVRCAVSGKPITIDQLKYWDVELQEAYATAEISMQRYLEKIKA